MADKECTKCIHHPVCKTAESCDGYVSGCKHFQEGWISVKDRLPEEEERVLIYTKTNITNYGTYTKRYGAYRKEGFICQDGFMWLNTASHWMPLPQPPKGE